MTKTYNDAKSEAARLGISERTLARHCKDAHFPFIRLGSRILFDPDLSDSYLAGLMHTGRAAELAQQSAA